MRYAGRPHVVVHGYRKPTCPSPAMAPQHAGGVDENTPLLSSVATSQQSSDPAFVLRHEFKVHDYARRFAPARYLLSVFEPSTEGRSVYASSTQDVCVTTLIEDGRFRLL